MALAHGLCAPRPFHPARRFLVCPVGAKVGGGVVTAVLRAPADAGRLCRAPESARLLGEIISWAVLGYAQQLPPGLSINRRTPSWTVGGHRLEAWSNISRSILPRGVQAETVMPCGITD